MNGTDQQIEDRKFLEIYSRFLLDEEFAVAEAQAAYHLIKEVSKHRDRGNRSHEKQYEESTLDRTSRKRLLEKLVKNLTEIEESDGYLAHEIECELRELHLEKRFTGGAFSILHFLRLAANNCKEDIKKSRGKPEDRALKNFAKLLLDHKKLVGETINPRDPQSKVNKKPDAPAGKPNPAFEFLVKQLEKLGEIPEAGLRETAAYLIRSYRQAEYKRKQVS